MQNCISEITLANQYCRAAQAKAFFKPQICSFCFHFVETAQINYILFFSYLIAKLARLYFGKITYYLIISIHHIYKESISMDIISFTNEKRLKSAQSHLNKPFVLLLFFFSFTRRDE